MWIESKDIPSREIINTFIVKAKQTIKKKLNVAEGIWVGYC